MRKRFEQQMILGRVAIEELELPTTIRIGPIPAMAVSLQQLFMTAELSEQIFEILETKILPLNNKLGRPGMELWHIFVLSQVRQALDVSYDQLHYMANYDKIVRMIMGVENINGLENELFGYQAIVENVGLIDEEMLVKINAVIVDFGHQILKKKRRP